MTVLLFFSVDQERIPAWERSFYLQIKWLINTYKIWKNMGHSIGHWKHIFWPSLTHERHTSPLYKCDLCTIQSSRLKYNHIDRLSANHPTTASEGLGISLQKDSDMLLRCLLWPQRGADKIHLSVCCNESWLAEADRPSGLSPLSICPTVVLINCQPIVAEWNFKFNLHSQRLGRPTEKAYLTNYKY